VLEVSTVARRSKYNGAVTSRCPCGVLNRPRRGGVWSQCSSECVAGVFLPGHALPSADSGQGGSVEGCARAQGNIEGLRWLGTAEEVEKEVRELTNYPNRNMLHERGREWSLL